MTAAMTRYAEDPATAAAVEVYTRLDVVRNVLAPDLTDQELTLFSLVASRSGLDPFAKQIHAVKRKGRVTFQTGIDGYRSIAERTHEYEGSDLPEYGPDCACGSVPKPHPEYAEVTVYRVGKRPQAARAYWHEFHPGENDFMWTKMPRNQLAKCAEALALRKAFPYVYADIYTNEEMAQAGPEENASVREAASKPTPRERLAARRAALEQPTEGSFREAPNTDPEEGRADGGQGVSGAQPAGGDSPEVAAAAIEPEVAPAPGPQPCDAPSPYDDASERCVREAGHSGNHRNGARESWA